jgi:hypothetical protein
MASIRKYQVFISRSSKDSPWAKRLAKGLAERGVQVWLDESSPEPGSSSRRDIEKALRDSDTIVALIDEENVKSPYLFFELGIAVAMGKKIVPVVLGNVDLSGLPFDVKQVQDMKKTPPEKIADQLTAEAREQGEKR